MKNNFIIAAILLGIFFILAFKNPFSTRSPIPNLEPYPDTLYYSIPALNFIHGQGFHMKAFDYESKIITPPVYSLYLLPFFVAFQDVRAYFIANMILAFGSIMIFFFICRILFRGYVGDAISLFIGFFLVSSIYFYTLPSLLMAENITFFISMGALYLLITEHRKSMTIIADTIGAILILIKFSNVPLAISFYGLYGLDLIFDKKKRKFLIPFIISTVISGSILILYVQTSHILVGHKNLSQGASFGLQYFIPNFMQYLSFVIGGKAPYIWYGHRMISVLLVVPAIAGIFVGLKHQQFRMISIKMLGYGLSVMIFMSFFYFVDARYIFVVYPILLFFVGIALISFHKKFKVHLLMILILLYLFVSQLGLAFGERMIITYKKQIGLNFKHAEVPWHYIAVQEFNSYFKKTEAKKPYLATFLHPYFVGAYMNNNYNYLPIDRGQEFFADKRNPSKEYLNSLPAYYKKLLQQGNKVYISPYFKNNNADTWGRSYDELTKQFVMKEVHDGCLGSCKIYSLELVQPQ